MLPKIGLAVLCALLAMVSPSYGAEARDDSRALARELMKQVNQLRREMRVQREQYESRLKQMQQRIEALEGRAAKATVPSDPEAQLQKIIASQQESPAPSSSKAGSGRGRVFASLNPDISLIIDTFYYRDDSGEGINHIFEHMGGFGHSHGSDGHDHGGLDQGFNLREVELWLSAAVDPYLKGYATLSFSGNSAEVEEAVAETLSLPWGFKLKAGKYMSNFSRINAQHPHSWNFVDRPMIYELTLGDHGLNDLGVQASWLAPLHQHLLFGLEGFQGNNEWMFNYIGGDNLPERDGPRLWVGWVKWSPLLPDKHALQLGAFGARGVDQEAHDEDSDGNNDHFFNGYSCFYGLDFVYKYTAGRAHGHGDFTLEGSYLRRRIDLTLTQHDLEPGLVGSDKISNQDGYYLQGVYGFLPRWRGGLRWEQVGLVNDVQTPEGQSEYDPSWRVSGMIDFSPSEFSRFRFQTSYGGYQLDDGSEDNAWQVFLQMIISLGSHGAHEF